MHLRARIVSRMSLDVRVPGEAALMTAVAHSTVPEDEQLLAITGDGQQVAAKEVDLGAGGRVHLLDMPAGQLVVTYTATARCGVLGAGPPVSDAERIVAGRPSRYCPADRLTGFAVTQFGSLPEGLPRVQGIVDWVANHLSYESGSSRPTDDAVDTLLSGLGVCRDYAHVCVTLCRALDVPARLVSVYAPGLAPMDFHAVFEAAVDGRWQVFDATRLAPRAAMVRVATGRDAADTAFLTTMGAVTELLSSEVTVTAEPELPAEDPRSLVALC